MEAIKKIELNRFIKIVIITILGTLLLTVSSKIKIPFYPVPMTMQTFVVLFLGLAFGYKVGLATVSLTCWKESLDCLYLLILQKKELD